MASFFEKYGWVAGYNPFVAEEFVARAGLTGDRKKALNFIRLLRAIEDGDGAKMRELLALGIDPNLRVPMPEKNLWGFAVSRAPNPDCLAALLEAGAEINHISALIKLATREFTTIIPEVVRRGAPLDVQDVEGFTPLGSCCLAGKAAGAKTLLECGASPDFMSAFEGGKRASAAPMATPLMLAAWGGFKEIAQMLIDAGADVNKLDAQGRNAIAWARKGPRKAGVTALLTKAGLSVDLAASVPEVTGPPEFVARAKLPGYKAGLALARKLTGLNGERVETPEGPIEGAKAFPVAEEDALQILRKLRERMTCGVAFVSEDLTENGGPCVVLIPAADVYEGIAALETPAGQEVSSEQFIQWLRDLEKEQPFEVTHVAADRLEANFTTEIKDAEGWAKRIEMICDDVAEGNLLARAEDLKRSRRLELWWD